MSTTSRSRRSANSRSGSGHKIHAAVAARLLFCSMLLGTSCVEDRALEQLGDVGSIGDARTLVDGSSPGKDALDMGAESTCVPDCAGRECGDDGCGGQCGDCDDGLACTADSCTQGKCNSTLEEGFCLIDGVCLADGDIDSLNSCRVCHSQVDSGEWGLVADGVVCGVGLVCHQGLCCDHAAACDGRECGDDGCGGSCGECLEGYQCLDDGGCEALCEDYWCQDKECGVSGSDGECDCGDCDDGNPCTEDLCGQNNKCYPVPTDGTCNDGDACTTGDHCEGGFCAADTVPDCIGCASGDDCHDFEDGDLCNGTLKCLEGKCLLDEETVISCESPDQCSLASCDPATGECEVNDVLDGTFCDDLNFCTELDYCSGGVCKGLPVDCDDLNSCTADDCDPDAGCIYQNKASSCGDGDPCTINDHCQDGLCVGDFDPACQCEFDADCDDGNACTTDACTDWICVNAIGPEICFDGKDNDCDGMVDEDDCEGIPCGGFMEPVCPEGMYCQYLAGQCDWADIPGMCVPIPDTCLLLWAPVCGCDGLTYGNQCTMEEAQQSMDYQGECVPDCKLLDPWGYGPCAMVLGWGFTGNACTLISGCSCEPDCGAVFATEEDCLEACLPDQ